MPFLYNPITSQLDLVGSSSGVSVHVDTFTLGAGDITNKYVVLTHTPTVAASAVLLVKDAPAMFYSDDYQITSSIRLDWSGLGLDGILSAGDKLTVIYY